MLSLNWNLERYLKRRGTSGELTEQTEHRLWQSACKAHRRPWWGRQYETGTRHSRRVTPLSSSRIDVCPELNSGHHIEPFNSPHTTPKLATSSMILTRVFHVYCVCAHSRAGHVRAVQRQLWESALSLPMYALAAFLAASTCTYWAILPAPFFKAFYYGILKNTKIEWSDEFSNT